MFKDILVKAMTLVTVMGITGCVVGKIEDMSIRRGG